MYRGFGDTTVSGFGSSVSFSVQAAKVSIRVAMTARVTMCFMIGIGLYSSNDTLKRTLRPIMG